MKLLIGVEFDENKILNHPKLGGSWDRFIIEQIPEITNNREAYFWATHSGAELDLLIFRAGKRIGFEIKYSDAPSRTRSMSIALQDLNLDQLHIIYSGKKSYPIDDNIQVVGIEDLLEITKNI